MTRTIFTTLLLILLAVNNAMPAEAALGDVKTNREFGGSGLEGLEFVGVENSDNWQTVHNYEFKSAFAKDYRRVFKSAQQFKEVVGKDVDPTWDLNHNSGLIVTQDGIPVTHELTFDNDKPVFRTLGLLVFQDDKQYFNFIGESEDGVQWNKNWGINDKLGLLTDDEARPIAIPLYHVHVKKVDGQDVIYTSKPKSVSASYGDSSRGNDDAIRSYGCRVYDSYEQYLLIPGNQELNNTYINKTSGLLYNVAGKLVRTPLNFNDYGYPTHGFIGKKIYHSLESYNSFPRNPEPEDDWKMIDNILTDMDDGVPIMTDLKELEVHWTEDRWNDYFSQNFRSQIATIVFESKDDWNKFTDNKRSNKGVTISSECGLLIDEDDIIIQEELDLAEYNKDTILKINAQRVYKSLVEYIYAKGKPEKNYKWQICKKSGLLVSVDTIVPIKSVILDEDLNYQVPFKRRQPSQNNQNNGNNGNNENNENNENNHPRTSKSNIV